MNNITYKIVDSISKIGKEEWNSLFGDIPEGYRFYKTLDESGLLGFSFFYALAYQGGELILAAPLFVSDFYLDIAVEGNLEKIIKITRKFLLPRFLITRTLFCGSPFGESGVLGIKADLRERGGLIRSLADALSSFAAEKNCPLVMFKDFLKEDSTALDSLVFSGFLKVRSFPSVVTALNFSTFDEYLKSLGGSTRKGLRRRIKKAYLAGDIRVEVVERVDDIIDDIYRLYLSTYNRGGIKFEKLSREFFINAGRNLEPHAKFFLYYVNGKLGAFNLCFLYGNLLIDKFIGFDYDIANDYSLYFVSWCFNIEWCIKNSVRYYQSGQTDYGPKLRLGGRLVPLFAYLKHRNTALNLLLRLQVRLLKPDNFDDLIKNAGDI